MSNTARVLRIWKAPTFIALVAIGCSSGDERLVELSRQSADRQAEQNRLVETNNRQVIDAADKLVQADAQGRKENVEAHRQIEAERFGINQQRDFLEQERRQIADQRNRDPIVAESIRAVAGLIAAVLPLAVCLALLRGLFHKSDEEALADVLIEELVAQSPLLGEPDALPSPGEGRDRALLRNPPRTAGRLSLEAQSSGSSDSQAACLVVLEGTNDVEFLRRLSRILHEHDHRIPDLGQLEADGRLAFQTSDTRTIASMSVAQHTGRRQFHLLDRELPPVDSQRQCLVEFLNQSPNCRAVLTSKRAMENYLHPAAVREACGVDVAFEDFDDVPAIAAIAQLRQGDARKWEELSHRARRRLRYKAKKWLNRQAVDRMTSALLAERDPHGEVRGWLTTIADLAGASSVPSAT
jgi:hypothetical protein